MFPFAKQLLAIFTVLASAGCIPEIGLNTGLAVGSGAVVSPPPPASQVPVTTRAPLCSSVVYGYLKGQPATAAENVPHPKRIIPPGTAVTQDYIASRTNVDLDESGVITRVWCG